jgi:hypothetical protein
MEIIPSLDSDPKVVSLGSAVLPMYPMELDIDMHLIQKEKYSWPIEVARYGCVLKSQEMVFVHMDVMMRALIEEEYVVGLMSLILLTILIYHPVGLLLN